MTPERYRMVTSLIPEELKKEKEDVVLFYRFIKKEKPVIADAIRHGQRLGWNELKAWEVIGKLMKLDVICFVD